MTKIGVVGAGFVGAVTAACFTHFGNEVICVDKKRQVIIISGMRPNWALPWMRYKKRHWHKIKTQGPWLMNFRA